MRDLCWLAANNLQIIGLVAILIEDARAVGAQTIGQELEVLISFVTEPLHFQRIVGCNDCRSFGDNFPFSYDPFSIACVRVGINWGSYNEVVDTGHPKRREALFWVAHNIGLLKSLHPVSRFTQLDYRLLLRSPRPIRPTRNAGIVRSRSLASAYWGALQELAGGGDSSSWGPAEPAAGSGVGAFETSALATTSALGVAVEIIFGPSSGVAGGAGIAVGAGGGVGVVSIDATACDPA